METEKKKLTEAEYLERVKNKQSVSRLEFSLDFAFADSFSEKLKKILADLTGANLTEANLSWADLTGANLTEANLGGAKGDFYLPVGVKMRVVKD